MDEQRRLTNIAFCMLYKNYFNHGASNHHLMCQVADAYEDLLYQVEVHDGCIQLYSLNEWGKELVLELTENAN